MNEESRISTLEADGKSVVNTLNDIRLTLVKAEDSRQANHTDVIQRLSRLETSQIAFCKYQEDCDAERKTINNDINAIKNGQSRQAGVASILAVIVSSGISAVIGFGAAILGRHQ